MTCRFADCDAVSVTDGALPQLFDQRAALQRSDMAKAGVDDNVSVRTRAGAKVKQRVSACIGRALSIFRVETEDEDLIRAQHAALARQLPLMYLILSINMLALVVTHFGHAPELDTVWVPLFFLAVGIWRGALWWRVPQREWSTEQIVRHLRSTLRLGPVIAATFVVWAFSLYSFGDAYQKAHVAFFMSVTIIGCILCMMQLRAMAVSMALIVTVPFCVFFFLTGNAIFMALSINSALVTVAMLVVLFNYDGDFRRMISAQRDLRHQHDEMAALSAENLRLANIDPLCGIANRRAFTTELDRIFVKAERCAGRFAVGVLDLDGFKPVNDIYGHNAGDTVLIEVVNRLQALDEGSIFFSRIGGDEFGLIIDADLSDDRIMAIGRRICETLVAPIDVPGASAQISASVGFAAYPDAGTNPSQIFERADYALYNAKQHHRGEPVIFSTMHETKIRDFGRIEQALRHADLDQEVSLVFQPIVEVATETVLGFEALARWQSPALGRVMPTDFIAVAERTNQIGRLTEVILRKALVEATSWPDEVRLSVNLSARDIVSPEAILRIVAIIRRSGFDARRIDFEITETALMTDVEQSSAAIATLKALGSRIALDDFGTGYSSLSYVHRLPLDKIKIDGSFVTGIEQEGAGRELVRTVVDLCRNLALVCIVEGIETREQASILWSLGCRIAQGYYFGKPLSAEDAFRRVEPALMAGAPLAPAGLAAMSPDGEPSARHAVDAVGLGWT